MKWIDKPEQWGCESRIAPVLVLAAVAVALFVCRFRDDGSAVPT